MESENEIILRQVDGLLRDLKLPEEARVDLLKQLFRVVPSPVPSPLQLSLLSPDYEAPPILKMISELLKSEREYLHTLERLTTIFVLPILVGTIKVSFHAQTTILGSIDTLINVHKAFLTHVKQSYDNFPEHNISSAFLNSLASFQIYVSFVRKFSRDMYHLTKEIQDSAAFCEFVKEQEKKHGLNLQSLISVPLSRIPQYNLFIDSLQDLTQKDDADYVPLQNVIAQFKSLKENIDQSLQLSDQMEQILDVQGKLCQMPEGFELCDEDREYVGEGSVRVANSKDRRSHHFFLFNDAILQTQPLPKEHYRFVQFLPIQYSQLLPLEGGKWEWTNGEDKSIVFSPTKGDSQELLPLLQVQIQTMDGSEVFGRPLKALLRRNTNARCLIPEVVDELIGYIRRNCCELSGVFRISGSAIAIEQARNRINRGIPLQLETLDDNVVTGLLKQFFREMEDTLIPIARYPQFVACLESEDIPTSLNRFLATIPTENFHLLKRLMELLHTISQKEEINKMSAHNLTIIFGPNLAREKPIDADNPMAEMSFVSRPLFEAMIENYDKVFPSFRRTQVSTQEKRNRFSSSRSVSLLGFSRQSVTRELTEPVISSTPAQEPPSPEPAPVRVTKKSSKERASEKKKRRSKSTNKRESTSVALRKSRKNRDKLQKNKEEIKVCQSLDQEEIHRRARRGTVFAGDTCHCCGRTISDDTPTIVISESQRCHQTCFVCDLCGSPLTFENFVLNQSNKVLSCLVCPVDETS